MMHIVIIRNSVIYTCQCIYLKFKKKNDEHFLLGKYAEFIFVQNCCFELIDPYSLSDACFQLTIRSLKMIRSHPFYLLTIW